MIVTVGNDYIGPLLKAFITILFSGIIVIPFFPLRIKPLITILVVSLIAVVTSYLAVIALSSGSIEYLVGGGVFFGVIPVRIDALSAWFILIINLTSFTGVIYGSGYLKSYTSAPSFISFHWMMYVIFQSSMIMVTIVQHSIAFIVAWEIMSLSSFLLVLFDYTNPRVVKAGINYLVQMHLSVILLTVAFIWVYARTGTFDFKGISTFFGSNVNKWLFLVFFAGFGLKSGFIGLHSWLPQAHPAAPSHISGVMSGVIVKLGIYGIFRIIFCLKSDFLVIGYIVIIISILTGLFGILNAAVHRDFKKMLAYCTIENIGIIGVGMGLGLIGMGTGQKLLIFLGFGGALLHVLNHALYKSLLFYSAGSVYNQTHTRDMDKLGGLIKKMPRTAMLFLAGSIAIGGIPPLNGFISEFLIYAGILTGMNTPGTSQIILMILTIAGLSFIGGVSLLTFTKTFGTIFLGVPRKDLKHEPKEVSSLMLVPQYIIIFSMIGISFFPVYFVNIVVKIVNVNTFQDLSITVSGLSGYLSVMKNISLASVLFIIVTGLIFFLRWAVTRKAAKEVSATWGCAYVAPNTRMQYTGKSYSKSLGKLLNFMMIEKKGYAELNSDEIFPMERKYRSFYLDVIESKIIDPLLLLIRRFIDLFQFVQNGRIQAYVIYGIVFILVIFIGTILNFWH
jgi:formate hydrogenlyase subunit 3/multisubunit Na+/H+ antiporter MnhD subunit